MLGTVRTTSCVSSTDRCTAWEGMMGCRDTTCCAGTTLTAVLGPHCLSPACLRKKLTLCWPLWPFCLCQQVKAHSPVFPCSARHWESTACWRDCDLVWGWHCHCIVHQGPGGAAFAIPASGYLFSLKLMAMQIWRQGGVAAAIQPAIKYSKPRGNSRGK